MEEPLKRMAETMKSLEGEVDKLRQQVNGQDSGLLERVKIIEDQEGADPTSLAGTGEAYETPTIITDFIDEEEPVEELLPDEMEFGKPTANVTTDVATVTMQPCDSAGASFASAPTATAYVANDRQTQATAARGWTTSTVLSFIRFTPWVAGTPNIEGVLIGESPGNMPSRGIIMYDGVIADIPTGWTLCDGGNDGNGVATPDMSGMFVVGYDTSDTDYDTIGNTGGYKLHGPTENEHAKFRTYPATTGDNNWAYWANDQVTPFDPVDTDNRPLYYTLAFIRKD